MVYTCTQSGIALTWNIPGLFEDPEAYVVGTSQTYVGAVRVEAATNCTLNLTAIWPDSLTSTLRIPASNEIVRNGSTIVCEGQEEKLMMSLSIASE